MSPRGRVGNDADQGTRLDVQAGPGPKGAEYGLGRDLDELLHHGVAVIFALVALKIRLAPEPPAHGFTFPIELACGHGGFPHWLQDRRRLALPGRPRREASPAGATGIAGVPAVPV